MKWKLFQQFSDSLRIHCLFFCFLAFKTGASVGSLFSYCNLETHNFSDFTTLLLEKNCVLGYLCAI